MEAASRILTAFEAPFIIEGQQAAITASLGISLNPWDGESPQELIIKADSAFYGSKGRGRNRWTFFEEA